MQEQVIMMSFLIAVLAFPLITECTPVQTVQMSVPSLCEPVSFNSLKKNLKKNYLKFKN